MTLRDHPELWAGVVLLALLAAPWIVPHLPKPVRDAIRDLVAPDDKEE
jgi:hypothetical protein